MTGFLDSVSRRDRKKLRKKKTSVSALGSDRVLRNDVKQKYALDHVVGAGATAAVFRAYSPAHKHIVAIKIVRLSTDKRSTWSANFQNLYRKVFRSKLAKDPSSLRVKRDYVENEFRLWNKVGNICPFTLELLQVLNFRDQIWFIMPLNRPIKTFLETVKRKYDLCLPMLILKELFAGIYLALREMNKIGIMHRDVKLENILITSDMIVKLADFGSCETFLSPDGTPKEMQTDENSFGTYYTAPPEVFFTGASYNETLDTFSLPITMLTAKYLKPSWEVGEFKKYYNCDDVMELYKECKSNILCGKWSKARAELEYLHYSRVKPKDDNKSCSLISKNMAEIERFWSFAHQSMKWDINSRLTIAQACEHSYLKEVIERWERDPFRAARCLKQSIDNFAKLQNS
mmetsp:Transcript_14760/g.19365  ORF Transcript_14760/g.19365 Transcript_14760/m.19365 type:complete len:402 (-) Transcript_14760:364-1569(-)